MQSDALFILLVEKDAAFMRLAEDRFYQTYPCIIITAKGQPDVASRSSPMFKGPGMLTKAAPLMQLLAITSRLLALIFVILLGHTLVLVPQQTY